MNQYNLVLNHSGMDMPLSSVKERLSYGERNAFAASYQIEYETIPQFLIDKYNMDISNLREVFPQEE